MLLVTMNKEHHNNVNITFIFKVKADNEISNIDYKAIIVNTEKMSDSPPPQEQLRVRLEKGNYPTLSVLS